MAWEIEGTDEFTTWYAGLPDNDKAAVSAVVDLLEEQGPALKRPVVGEIAGSRVKNLKELVSGSLRVLFVFDPRQVAILLLGGDKAGTWKKWYPQAIAQAEDLYDTYLQELRDEGLIE